MLLFRQILVLFLILISASSFSQKTISNNEKVAVIERIKELIDSNYVFKDKVNFINNSLDDLKSTTITTHKYFADILTNHLVNITKDKHFKIQYNPALVKARRESFRRQQKLANQNQENEEEEEEYIDLNLWYAKKENFGFEKVRILEGNIGYIQLNFWQPLDWVKSTIDATMQFLTNTDALIIDLTKNGGGYSPTDSYLASYFFDKEPMIWTSSYNRQTDEITSTLTFGEIGGKRYLNKPIYILVSENTFSLGEQFAYSMKHFEKAVIIGQASAGAAHAIDFIEVNDNYLIQLPIIYSIHPVTKTDWEETGVVPHIKTSKSKTLQIAHLKSLDTLLTNPDLERLKKRYYKIKAKINKQ